MVHGLGYHRLPLAPVQLVAAPFRSKWRACLWLVSSSRTHKRRLVVWKLELAEGLFSSVPSYHNVQHTVQVRSVYAGCICTVADYAGAGLCKHWMLLFEKCLIDYGGTSSSMYNVYKVQYIHWRMSCRRRRLFLVEHSIYSLSYVHGSIQARVHPTQLFTSLSVNILQN
jgi:hypothetical protein